MGMRAAWLYDNYGEFLASMNVFAWAFCSMLLIKGHLAPSSTDSGHTGSYVKDFYWGYELYPRLPGNIDVKMFTNCRFGMMMWAVATLCFAAKSAELHNGQLPWGMAVNVGLQICYIFKFFHWEMGYMCSMDIQHDRAGYYICWGCLVWVPSVYTSHSFALAGVGNEIPYMSATTAILLFAVGWFMIYINYESDQQRYVFRQNKGDCLLYGKKPHYITAEYKTEKGDTRTNLLLVDGWWKYSRHFHYVPEILAALCWSLPAQATVWPAYFYVVFLTILLTDRAFRDDDRCRMKYGKYWEQYCSEVPYKIVPGVV
jgi:7-dehydrocholesterol reductase